MHIFALLIALWAQAPAAQDTARWTTVSVGDDHACALDARGRAFCWGLNHGGQLGGRTAIHCGIVGESGRRSCYPVPSDTAVAVEGGRRFVSLSAGRHRTCALDAEGRAFCWGRVGEGGRDRCLHEQPCSFAPVAYLPEHRFRELRVESGADCGVTREGETLCSGELAEDRWEAAGSLRPLAPGMRPRHFDTFVDWPVATLCVVDAEGSAWCRGDNKLGQLGNGTRPWTYGDPRERSDTLTRVVGGIRFRQVLALASWTCGLDVEGRAHCWGQRSRERRPYRRDDPEDPRLCIQVLCAPAPVPVAPALRFRALSKHNHQHDSEVCGLTAEGAAHCWGFEGVARPVHPDLRFATLASSDEFGSGSCGVTTGGELYCWGVVNKPPERVRIAHPAARRSSR